MRFIGIDPGAEGGIAVLGPQPIAYPMPMVGKELDGAALCNLLLAIQPELVVVEKAQSMPKQGIASTFRYGVGYGKILGVLEGMRLPYVAVAPRQWKDAVLKGTKKDKEAAINYTRTRWPQINLTPGRKIKPHDGMADAVCLAEYAKRWAGEDRSGGKL